MRDTAEYNRCLVKGCAYMLRAPMTVCNYHAADLVVTDEHGDARRLVEGRCATMHSTSHDPA